MDFKPHASNPIQDLLDKLNSQNVTLAKARNEYLLLEAQRKHFEASMIVDCPESSHAAKVTTCQAQQEWLDFHLKLARAESVYEFQKLKFEILSKEFQAVYLEMKLDGPLINKQT